MSDKFKEYVRSSAFNLSLSKAMIETLLYLDGTSCSFPGVNIITIRALRDRGLTYGKEENDQGKEYLTEAGKAVVNLLIIAGYGPEGAPTEEKKCANS